MMKNLQFYKYATWVLVLLNLAMLAFFFFTKPPHHSPPPPDGHRAPNMGIIDILRLDKQQHEDFLLSVDRHQDKMHSTDEQQRKLLKPYFYSIIDTTKKSGNASLLNEIQQLERNKIESTYLHFEEVKSILRDEQQADFKDFIDGALKNILSDKNSNRPPPRDF